MRSTMPIGEVDMSFYGTLRKWMKTKGLFLPMYAGKNKVTNIV